MQLKKSFVLTSACLLVLSDAASAQEASSPNLTALEEVVVTARRKDESLQDVPLTVNVVTGDSLEKLSIREFQDIQTLVPGLTISGNNVVNASASVRGITFNQVTNGNNGVLEFYLNDSPLPASTLFGSMFDIGQIELLRGPQGTLRGRAAPSGSMTVTTRRPVFNESGGYANGTITHDGEVNVNAAINVPMIEDVLAIRLAALRDENDVNSVTSDNNGTNPHETTLAARATVRFEPTSNLSFILTYLHQELERLSYGQMESLQVVDPTAPASPVYIHAFDRRSRQDTPTPTNNTVDNFNLQAQWSFLGQKLNYVGSSNHIVAETVEVLDPADFFGPASPSFAQGYGRPQESDIRVKAHELRISSEERLFGMLDYIVGGFYEKLDSPTNYESATILLLPPPNGRVLYTPINRLNSTKEQSVFGNLTLSLPTGTEISAGIRYLEYQADGGLIANGVPNPQIEQHDDFDATIYTGSIKQSITDDLMVYGTVGTSWRPAPTIVGDFNTNYSPLETAFTKLPAEESTSYELGAKASFLERRMQLNLSVFHQEFENSPWRSSQPVYFINTASNPAGGPGATFPPAVSSFNFAGAVPITIDGVEVEWSFAPIERWSVNLSAAYTNSEIDNGLVPCNDYFPHDGVPDADPRQPTLTQIQDVSGGENLVACRVNYSGTLAPDLSSTLQSEYSLPVTSSFDSYIRGLVTYYGDTPNDPTNRFDDIDSYAMLNLYLGLRAPDGAWEVSVYGKNVTETERVLTRQPSAMTTSYRNPISTTSSTTYRSVSVTAPREFGLTLRYAFGSR